MVIICAQDAHPHRVRYLRIITGRKAPGAAVGPAAAGAKPAPSRGAKAGGGGRVCEAGVLLARPRPSAPVALSVFYPRGYRYNTPVPWQE